MPEKLKLMIADDEPMVCVVVQSSVHWEELGLELSGIAHDGLELLDKIKESRPDIVITDISMPELSGLELIEQIRRDNIECKFIIISGYKQFEYAHKALKNNVDDYLLKPIDEQELNESLLRLITAIHGERMRGQSVERLIASNKKDKENIRRILLGELIKDENGDSLDEKEIREQYGITFGKGIYQIVVAKFDITSQDSFYDKLSSVQTKLISIFKNVFENSIWELLVEVGNDRILFGIYYNPEYAGTANSNFKKFFELSKNIVELFMGFVLTVGVSAKHESFTDFPRAFREAEDAVFCRLVEGIDQILFYESLHIPEKHWSESDLAGIRERLNMEFEIQNVDSFRHYITGLYFVDRKSCNVPQMVRLSLEMVNMFFEKQRELGNEIENGEERHNLALRKICSAVSVRDLKQAVGDSISGIMEELEEKRKNQKKKPVREVINYIGRHYQEALTLEVLAEEVHLNPVYLSSIFKKETGENFVDYLHKYRIEVAKDLLRSEDTPIVNIALNVGYFDAKYFSKMFRKYVGIKPSEYRRIYG